VVDDATPATVYASVVVPMNVNYPPPPLLRRLLWLWLTLGAAAVVVAAVVAGVRLRSRAQAQDVRGLVALLYRDGQQLSYLHAPSLPSRQFSFVVRDEGTATPRLDLPGDGDPSYTVTRRVDGSCVVRLPSGGRAVLGRGRRVELPDIGVTLRIRDDREELMEAGTDPAGPPAGPSG